MPQVTPYTQDGQDGQANGVSGRILFPVALKKHKQRRIVLLVCYLTAISYQIKFKAGGFSNYAGLTVFRGQSEIILCMGSAN